jgi:thioredoxin reductase (NADPH)
MQRFGGYRHFADGERVFETGKPGAGIHVVLSGALRVTGRDAHGHDFYWWSTAPATFRPN